MDPFYALCDLTGDPNQGPCFGSPKPHAGIEARAATEVSFSCAGALNSGTGCVPSAAPAGHAAGASRPASLALRLHHAGPP